MSSKLAMRTIRSDDTEIVYQVIGSGPPMVLLHPFPANRAFWMPAAQALLSRYRLILPDLRGHGDSGLGDGPATMGKHAGDVARVMDDAGVPRAAFCGVSIGGYTLFEFWRRYRDRVSAMVLCNTRASADSLEGRATRLKAAIEVVERGTEQFFESMIPKLIGETTRHTRPDLVEGALKMMRKMSAQDVAMVQRGMAERPDSLGSLKSIHVPVLVLAGEEDTLIGMAEAELMRQNIARSELKVVANAGHYSPWERPREVGQILRGFLDSVSE